MRRRSSSPLRYRGSRRRKLLPFVITGMLVPVILALVVAAIFVLPGLESHAAPAINSNCALIVPPHPLTAQGLATPYQLTALDAGNGPCHETNTLQTAFVQASVLDPVTGSIAIYDPLVIDQGTQPAIAPIVPNLPQGAVIGIWFGFNGNSLTLQDSQGSLQEGHCVNGADGSIFGQVSYCNAPAFFQVANRAIQANKLMPPALQKANDGLLCPTVRDFSLVDQDQSDNVTTMYLVNANGQIAQMTQKNIKAIPNAQKLFNGSDNGLLDSFVDPALGCSPWMAPNLADAGNPATGLPLDELQAAAHQAAPVALVPAGDPMVLLNGNPDLNKINAYRAGVDQQLAQSLNEASTRIYCTNLLAISPQRMLLDAHFTKVFATPDAGAANSLFTFLAQRFVTTYGANGLNCTKLLGQPDPVSVKKDGNGVAISATIDGSHINSPVNCSINGAVLTGCTGTTSINGQACTFTFDKNANQVDVSCPALTTGQQ
ncbi:MAG TPA: hypothetical protein VKR42_12085 [Ktedonobacteraceae bacterium]|nr:hypothetical protein [Ktedonobacteraceae bacterium]